MCSPLRYLREANADEDYLSFVKSLENSNPKPFDEKTLEHLSLYLDRDYIWSLLTF